MDRSILTSIGFLILLLAIPTPLPAQPADRRGDPLPAGAVARLGSTWLRLDRAGDDRVVSAFSPDGRWLATARGRAVCVWDAASGRPGRRWTLVDGAKPTDLAFAADGATL